MKHGTILAFDYGLKRVGVATGEIALKSAHPLTTLHNTPLLFEKILALTVEWQPIRFVLGEPKTVNGDSTAITKNVHAFAKNLQNTFKIPVDLIDERYTSVIAESLLKKMGAHFARHKGKVDALSAQIILQTWFNTYEFA